MTALERLAAEDAARAAARVDGCACDLPATLAPLAAAAEGVEAGDACGEEATARQTLDLLHLRRQRGACLCDDAGRAHPPALPPGRVARLPHVSSRKSPRLTPDLRAARPRSILSA